MDTLMLKWHMKKNGDTVNSLANKLGMASSTLYLKLRNDSSFTQREIQSIVRFYKLAPKDVVQIFFN